MYGECVKRPMNARPRYTTSMIRNHRFFTDDAQPIRITLDTAHTVNIQNLIVRFVVRALPMVPAIPMHVPTAHRISFDIALKDGNFSNIFTSLKLSSRREFRGL